MKLIKQAAVVLWCVMIVGCDAESSSVNPSEDGVLRNSSFTPTPEQIAAKEKTRSEVIRLFDALPEIPNTEIEKAKGENNLGKHKFNLQGNYQSYDSRLETILFSKSEPHDVCNQYREYLQNLGEEWNKPDHVGDKNVCIFDENKKLSGFRLHNLKASDNGGSFFFSIVVHKYPSHLINSEKIITRIEFLADYTLNVKARQKCSPEAINKTEWPCNNSQWLEPMAR